MNWDQIVLTDDQKELLCEMVEAERSVPKEERWTFNHVSRATSAQDLLLHNGFPEGSHPAYQGDVAELQAKGFLNFSTTRKGNRRYTLKAEAFEYYKYLKAEEKEPAEAVEEEVQRFLEAGRLASAYPEAHGKWKSAADALWAPDAEEHLTKIGHDCWKAIQAFATALVEEHEPEDVDEDPEKTINRVTAVLQKVQEEGEVGRTKRRYVEGLLDYWERLTPLVQRQRHDGEKATWEDGRAVVFGTGFAMYEIDRAVR